MIDFPDIPENVAYVIIENTMILTVLEDFWYLDDFWAEVCPPPSLSLSLTHQIASSLWAAARESPWEVHPYSR